MSINIFESDIRHRNSVSRALHYCVKKSGQIVCIFQPSSNPQVQQEVIFLMISTSIKHLSFSLFPQSHSRLCTRPPPPSRRGSATAAAAYRPWRRYKGLSSCAVCAPPKNISDACPLWMEEETNPTGLYLMITSVEKRQFQHLWVIYCNDFGYFIPLEVPFLMTKDSTQRPQPQTFSS